MAKITLFFCPLIFLAGCLTIYTDIKYNKIRNWHILFISSISIILYFIYFIKGSLNVSISLILNPVVGLIIGLLLYSTGSWKAGDAKLFFTYSLLIPINKYSTVLPFSSFVLFFNTFLISFLFVFPLFLKSIIYNKNAIINEIISRKTFLYFGKIFLITLGVSWIIKPILNLFSLKENVFLNFILLYVGYSLIYKFINKIKHKLLIAIVLVIGFISRYIFMPEGLFFTKFINYLKYILGYSVVFYILRVTIKLEDSNPKRIPFAPFVFLGAILSNTDFLWWAIKILTHFRK